MTVVKGANLALRFVLELCALAALCYWGFRIGGSAVMKILLGIGVPLLAAVLWGLFVSPRATLHAPLPVVLVVELAIFGAAVAALFAAGPRGLAWTLAGAIVLNEVLILVWGQRVSAGSV